MTTSEILWALKRSPGGAFIGFLSVISVSIGVGVAVCCTPAQEQVVLRDAYTVLTDSQEACKAEELAASLVPTGTAPGLVAGDLSLACGIDLAYAPKLERDVLAFENAQLDAGTSPEAGVLYKPGPKLIAAMQTRVRILDAAGAD
jgi:hypothetical protein